MVTFVPIAHQGLHSLCLHYYETKIFFIAFVFLSFTSTPLFAKDYPADFFGIKGNSDALNTRSIQFGIDYINAHGGGRLVLGAGVYLTGAVNFDGWK